MRLRTALLAPALLTSVVLGAGSTAASGQGGFLSASIDLVAQQTLGGVTPVGKVQVTNPGTGTPTNPAPWPVSASVDKVNLPDGPGVELWVIRRTSSDPAVETIPTFVTSIVLSRQRGTGSGSFLNTNIAPLRYEIRLADGAVLLSGAPSSNSNRPA